ncbi:DUF4956 domain-containing protein [Flaviflexus equikiangi]|uniref:DUF4956 domain-containing protein n=1 Tax=Flaviflexus equikiangi TaxID=2758573 RepID=UPI0015F3AB40|nr:DUF4956 domain-containing protein [Flaviflexus equikiangi]
MTATLPIAVDVLAISILVFGLYFPRHRRMDMALAYVTVNVGVLAVADTLASSNVAAGLGLGLFGVLSIIRLRSEELNHREIAYYFAALAIGLITGLADISPLQIGLIGLILAVIAIIDSRHVYPVESRRLVLDRAMTSPREIRDYVESLCGGRVVDMTVDEIDLVKDSTTVRVHIKTAVHRRESVEAAA